MNPEPTVLQLPRASGARVLALGAFLKNTACLLDGGTVLLSPLHGDLSDPEACVALDLSARALLEVAGGRVDAVAHDLHPDFPSTRLALQLAQEMGVPALAVQHHHAHIAAVQALHAWPADEPLVGLALDGIGLGHDGTAWGGEVLLLRGGRCDRVAHLPTIALPGGDVAAREPWRLAAAALHQMGRGAEIEWRLGPLVGAQAARVVQAMLSRDLNCPRSSAAGRWFDAMAGALGLSQRQSHEAQAAMALEATATDWLNDHDLPEPEVPTLDLWPLLASAFDTPRDADALGSAAARFHIALAAGLVHAACRAAVQFGATAVALGGGCFYNRLLTARVVRGLQRAGLRVLQTHTSALSLNCGDAGLAPGQAWAAAAQLHAGKAPQTVQTVQATDLEPLET